MQLLRLLYVTPTSIYVERLLFGGEGRDSYDRLESAAPVRGRRMRSFDPELVPIVGRHARTTAVASINFLRGASEGQVPR